MLLDPLAVIFLDNRLYILNNFLQNLSKQVFLDGAGDPTGPH